jgi:hypothetical protein
MLEQKLALQTRELTGTRLALRAGESYSVSAIASRISMRGEVFGQNLRWNPFT